MRTAVLHWFRSRQRALGRVVLAAFCLTWLQLAAVPCVMAVAAQPVAADRVAASDTMAMPAGMQMAPGEHCPYCPPAQPAPASTGDNAHCLYPHDPQVDSRAAFAAVLLAPPPPATIVIAADVLPAPATSFIAATSDPATGTPLAISYCRYLQ